MYKRQVPIPSAYFCVLADPYRYPWDTPSAIDVASFIIPQDAERGTSLDKFLVDIKDVETASKLEFFPGWRSEVPAARRRGGAESPEEKPVIKLTLDGKKRHRLLNN